MAKKGETQYMYSDEEEDIIGNAESIKKIIKLIRKSSNLGEIKNYVEAIDVHADNIIRDVNIMAEVR